MSEIVMTNEAEVEDFTDDLSDEALDRAEGAACCVPASCVFMRACGILAAGFSACCPPVADR
jgi:hypothetical protein